MKRLSSADAQFIAMEDGRTHAHICQVTIVDKWTAEGKMVNAERVKAVVEKRLPSLPPLRWVLRKVPFDLDYPVFVDDPDFDIDTHISEEAVPEPGTEQQLGELVGRIASRPLDRSLPLWEMYVIHGLENDRTAVVTKLHHAVVDGVSGVQLISTMLDDSPDGENHSPAAVDDAGHGHYPDDAELFVRGLFALPTQPAKIMQALPATLRNIDQLPTMRNVPGAELIHAAAEQAHRVATSNKDGRELEKPAPQAPVASFSGRISPHRRFAFSSISLPAIKRIKNSYDGFTVNDVVVALCAGALRRRMAARGDIISDDLVALVPFSVKGKDGSDDPYGNHLSSLMVPVPTTESDPAKRLQRSHEVMVSVKERHKAIPANLLVEANLTVPPALFARTARLISSTTANGWINPPFNFTISNIPGSPHPLYLAGARVVGQYPVNILLDGVGLSITLLSYEDRIDIGLTADRDLMADVWDLMDDLHTELDTLMELT